MHKDTLEYEIALRQFSVKSMDSKSCFSECNRLLYRYSLPNVYNLQKEITSLKVWKEQLKSAVDGHVRSQWATALKQSLKYMYLNVKSLRIGKVHQSLSTLPNDVRAVKNGNTKIRLLTGTYILQQSQIQPACCRRHLCPVHDQC